MLRSECLRLRLPVGSPPQRFVFLHSKIAGRVSGLRDSFRLPESIPLVLSKIPPDLPGAPDRWSASPRRPAGCGRACSLGPVTAPWSAWRPRVPQLSPAPRGDLARRSWRAAPGLRSPRRPWPPGCRGWRAARRWPAPCHRTTARGRRHCTRCQSEAGPRLSSPRAGSYRAPPPARRAGHRRPRWSYPGRPTNPRRR